MSNLFVEVSPNPLNINISQYNNDKTSTLILKNITNKYIIFKFLINTRGVLIAKPPTSFMKPFETVIISVNVVNYNLPMEEYNRTKLLIMFIESNEEIKTIDQAKKLYNILKNEEIEKQEALIKLNIIKESENKEGEGKNNDNENKNDEKITYINYSQLEKELIEKNNEIKQNLEIQRQKLENLVSQDKKNMNLEGKRKKYYNLDNITLVLILLVGLIMGANFACAYNRIFKK